jgi:uncharacterized protein DUF2510
VSTVTTLGVLLRAGPAVAHSSGDDLAAISVVLVVFWLIWSPLVIVVALAQRRSIGLAALYGLLLGPIGFYVVPRLPPGNRRTAGWYPYWYPGTYRRRYWDGRGWTDNFVSSWGRAPSGPPNTSARPDVSPDSGHPDPYRVDDRVPAPPGGQSPVQPDEHPCLGASRPGWYPDPRGTGARRWWNGETWSDSTSGSRP